MARISATKRTSSAVRKPQRVYAPYTALTLEEDCNIRTYGNAASLLFGFDNQAMIGKPIEIILPALGTRLRKDAADSAGPVQFMEVPMKARHADGSTLSVVVSVRPDKQGGNMWHLVLIRNLQMRPKG